MGDAGARKLDIKALRLKVSLVFRAAPTRLALWVSTYTEVSFLCRGLIARDRGVERGSTQVVFLVGL